ncbi:MAG: polysaccharide deacetylase family protein, partial [Verrucomicrobiota bacterium]
WDPQGVKLPPVEWRRRPDGGWEMERTLPDGVAFGVLARAHPDHLALRWWLHNGSRETVRDLRAQVCVMLGRAAGFTAQSGTNKLVDPPLVAAGDETGRRWILTAWEPLHRAWQNPPVPCLHADPTLPDVPPAETRAARGWLWFYEGTDPRAEIARRRREVVGRPDEGPPADPRAVRERVPDRLVVLTFDDSVASQHRVVRPLLKQYGFGATFFITEGFSFPTNKVDYLTWEQIAELHRDGFEIGNHTRSHLGVSADTMGRLREEVGHIAERC